MQREENEVEARRSPIRKHGAATCRSSGYFEQYYWQTVAAAAAAVETWRRDVTHVGVALVRQESVATVEGRDELRGMVRKGLRGEHS